MQHALMRLWKGSHGTGVLTLAAYEALGGLEGALSGQANAAYASLGAEQQRITEVMFRRLSARTASGRDIRLPTSLAEVARVAEVSPDAGSLSSTSSAIPNVVSSRLPGRRRSGLRTSSTSATRA